MPPTKLDRQHAERLDAADPLAAVRERFELRPGWIFLDANSVGPMPKAVRAAAQGLLDDWVNLRRRGWAERDWLQRPTQIGDAIARLIGAGPGEVVVCDSTTVNQLKAVSHALKLRPDRKVVLTQSGNFPTDVHVLQGLMHTSGGRLELRFAASEDEAVARLDPEVAVLAVSHVDYRSGERWDMARLSAAARAAGALSVWDLSHSAGAVPVDLAGAGADLAVGCGYKYLCTGPGGPAYIWARREIADATWPALAGWMGHADVLGFARDYEPHPGSKRFLAGTPMVGANELAVPAAEIWRDIAPDKVWAKHKSLTDLLIALLEQDCGPLGVEVASPREHGRRGGNVTFRAPGAGSVVEALLAEGVVSSFRKPDAIRFGVSPLVVSHVEIWEAVQRLRRVLDGEAWKRPEFAKVSV